MITICAYNACATFYRLTKLEKTMSITNKIVFFHVNYFEEKNHNGRIQ